MAQEYAYTMLLRHEFNVSTAWLLFILKIFLIVVLLNSNGLLLLYKQPVLFYFEVSLVFVTMFNF